eukprot:CAMPEP_0179305930 /NCGR_PEP_ID=MMETSP0797-20121207/49869_1 /TAXON_ID=47934 /ORGANISM="Dinophysis acuminata, Strain DAEP01" /LENGTH=212 /DNA_ID=CAMNT_0021015577 /DNA_START=21 /DNA_END=655 /DNA_ORIENTATION=-
MARGLDHHHRTLPRVPRLEGCTEGPSALAEHRLEPVLVPELARDEPPVLRPGAAELDHGPVHLRAVEADELPGHAVGLAVEGAGGAERCLPDDRGVEAVLDDEERGLHVREEGGHVEAELAGQALPVLGPGAGGLEPGVRDQGQVLASRALRRTRVAGPELRERHREVHRVEHARDGQPHDPRRRPLQRPRVPRQDAGEPVRMVVDAEAARA